MSELEDKDMKAVMQHWINQSTEEYWRDIITAEIRVWQKSPLFKKETLTEYDKGFLEAIRVASAIAYNAQGRKAENDSD
jgi:hypothetical protein